MGNLIGNGLDDVDHVDNFIDNTPDKPRLNDSYARIIFDLFRLPSHEQYAFNHFIKRYELFCIYEGKLYRVIGASTLGDIWLTTKFARDFGYELRICHSKVTHWGKTKRELIEYEL